MATNVGWSPSLVVFLLDVQSQIGNRLGAKIGSSFFYHEN